MYTATQFMQARFLVVVTLAVGSTFRAQQRCPRQPGMMGSDGARHIDSLRAKPNTRCTIRLPQTSLTYSRRSMSFCVSSSTTESDSMKPLKISYKG